MKTSAMVAVMLVRLAAVILIVLGVLFWTGHASSLVPLHILIGLVLVLALWALAVIALQSGVRPALPALAIVWGLIVVIFGLAQTNLLTGDAHWVVQVLHLLIGLVAVGFAEMLSARLRRA
jgi:hypothetical protein